MEDIDFELTDKQKGAIKKLESAFKACAKSGVVFHNCYGTLIAYDGAIVEEYVDDDEDDHPCTVGYSVESHHCNLAMWADDNHWIHLKDGVE